MKRAEPRLMLRQNIMIHEAKSWLKIILSNSLPIIERELKLDDNCPYRSFRRAEIEE